MAKFVYALASAMLIGSAVGADVNCTTAEAKDALALVDNTTYLNTCAPGSTWKLNNLFEIEKLNSADYIKFCNATECMHPIHELLETLSSCVTPYNGTVINLSEKIDGVHDKCHETLEALEGSHKDDDDDHDHANHSSGSHHSSSHSGSKASTNSTVPSPTPSNNAVLVSLSAAVVSTVAIAAVFN